MQFTASDVQTNANLLTKSGVILAATLLLCYIGSGALNYFFAPMH